MRMERHHVRNADCTARVTSIGIGRLGNWSELSCGHSADEHPVGSTITCKECQRDAENLAKLEEALRAGIVSHTRCHTTCASSISVYTYDKRSPTGVRALPFSVDDTPAAAALLAKYSGMAPLSPTEGR